MLTNKQPDKPGYYWWTDGHERLQVLEVIREGNKLYAQGEDISFSVKTFDDEDLWAYIKPPRLPKRKSLTDDDS